MLSNIFDYIKVSRKTIVKINKSVRIEIQNFFEKNRLSGRNSCVQIEKTILYHKIKTNTGRSCIVLAWTTMILDISITLEIIYVEVVSDRRSEITIPIIETVVGNRSMKHTNELKTYNLLINK